MSIAILRHRGPPRFLMGVALGLFLGGCGEGEGGPTIHRVSGKVLVDGKPAPKAKVTFYPSTGPANPVIPFAETDAEGSFRPSTRLTGDGAPSGDYRLTIVWPEIKVDRGEEIAGRDRLGGRYRDPSLSNLKVTIKEGENSLPTFDLKSSR